MNNYMYLKDCLEDIPKDKYVLPTILGKDGEDSTVIKDLTEIGSILISGATGSGKSVFLDSVIYTLLKTKTSDEVRIAIIDLKMGVEMMRYDGVPHLRYPVSTDAEKSYKILTKIIEDRLDKKEDSTPIVIFIDDLSDLLLTYGKEMEDILCMIATEGKNLGIHMLLSTSKPSSTVFTEKLKEVIPNRIAFALASEKDSMTVIGQEGAEKLRGNGDMIYRNLNTNETIRVQAPLVLEEEVQKLVKKLITRKCLCNIPYCSKCLLMNCNDDDCKVHTMEKKKQMRRRFYYPKIKKLIESRVRITPELMRKEFHLRYLEGVDLLNEFWDDELETYRYVYDRIKEERKENGDINTQFLQKEFSMSFLHATKLKKLISSPKSESSK